MKALSALPRAASRLLNFGSPFQVVGLPVPIERASFGKSLI